MLTSSLIAECDDIVPNSSPLTDLGSTPRRVVHVDDDPSLRELLRAYFSAAGYEYMSASDGASLFTLLAFQVPDLILLDREMPRVGGTSALMKLRSEPKTREVPVVILSAKPPTPSLNGLVRGYLMKPFKPEYVVDYCSSVMTTAH